MTRVRPVVLTLFVAACSSGERPMTTPPAETVAPMVTAQPAAGPESAAASGAAIAAGSGSGSGSGSAVASEPESPAGLDFIDDAKLLYRVAACGAADQPLPETLTKGDAVLAAKLAKIVDGHCKRISEQIAKFRAQYFDKGREWFDEVVPKTVPTTVVYPFGGGDLISALVAFPDATEITTISLEQSGDPRRLRKLNAMQISSSLGALRVEIGGLISVGSNTSVNLSAGQRNDLPGQVSSFLLGLVAGGYEPVAMYYFRFDELGEIDYLDQTEIDALESNKKTSLKHDWQSPSFSRAFANVELRYRKTGETAVRVHRHIAWNLGDDAMMKTPQLVRHLVKKGKVTVMTKGASYLLWRGDFSLIRNYMLDHLAWMLSDSTGIPPSYARTAGMVQETYGYYSGAFLEGSQASRHDEAFIELWRSQKKRKIPFRFGYVDKDKQAHVVVTRPK